MSEFTNVVIGVQARTTSKRFPGKVLETIDGKPVIKHVLDACERAAKYMNTHSQKSRLLVSVALVVPAGDQLVELYRRKITLIEGPEDDVLTRYAMLAEKTDADYIVRVTGDCPLIPPYLITKHIKTAVVNGYDYVSNVDEVARTAADGTDCEVVSRALLKYVHENANDAKDREHVTLMIRRDPPAWARIAHIIGYLNLSGLKLSIDTPEDLERVRAEYDRIKLALTNAENLHGRSSVHRF